MQQRKHGTRQGSIKKKESESRKESGQITKQRYREKSMQKGSKEIGKNARKTEINLARKYARKVASN